MTETIKQTSMVMMRTGGGIDVSNKLGLTSRMNGGFVVGHGLDGPIDVFGTMRLESSLIESRGQDIVGAYIGIGPGKLLAGNLFDYTILGTFGPAVDIRSYVGPQKGSWSYFDIKAQIEASTAIYFKGMIGFTITAVGGLGGTRHLSSKGKDEHGIVTNGALMFGFQLGLMHDLREMD
jgi:hypothetical protein